MDYSNITEIQITYKDGHIDLYKGTGIERFKKMMTPPSQVPQLIPASKYAPSGITIKPMSGDIFEQAELMKNASGFAK